MTDRIEKLEAELDSFDPARRQSALGELWALAQAGELALAPAMAAVNLHAHTFFSYNAHGWSPSKFAWLARKRGLTVAGMVDFDVLDGLEEFWAAGRLIGLKRCACLESRTFLPEFSTRVVNSPGEPGIVYHQGTGFPRAIEHPLLRQMRRTSELRNRELVRRVNVFLHPVELDYDREVLPLTPAGNATERHVCEAYSKKGDASFWRGKLGDCPADAVKLRALIRSRTMKQGGAGYVPPDQGAFPCMADMSRFVLEAGGIPTLTWLDGTSEGERCLDELFDVTAATGAAALGIVPDRNYTPGMKDEKLKNLYEVVEMAETRGFPVVIGTELNAPGNKFVDSLETAELKPLAPVFLKGAHILYAHSALQRESGFGYLSDWSRKHFPSVSAKNEFFEKLGRVLSPAMEDRLRALPADVAPENILAKLNPEP